MPLFQNPGLIVTADDFGRDPATNDSIRRCFAERLVSHTSIMVNMPGFDDACAIARVDGFAHRIGLHFNLTAGEPLTDAMKSVRAFCVDGRFVMPDRYGRYLPLSPDAQRAVADEARAQIGVARAKGLALSHLDSHNDIHIEPSVARIVVAVALEAGIGRIRPSRNCGVNRGFIRRVQYEAYNLWLSQAGCRGVRYFGTIDDVIWLASRGRLPATASVEIMTHPWPGPGDTVVDAPSQVPLADRLRALEWHLDPAAALN